ncbi:spore germination protein [Paenibacillus paeoniae]|uniref:Spore germination protein n=1 Tax=Paenibacillus paeoniae TaxID=2292705 RepID=A0A371PKZ4_9BACL|nr:spore germination protein [Paenibacillus paeoniae]REK76635.1 spore germination protein [Paenibacillus paeoniae]
MTTRFKRLLKKAGHTKDEIFLQDEGLPDQKLNTSLQQNVSLLKGVFQNCSDVIFRSLPVDGEIKLMIIYVNGLIDANGLEEMLLKPLIMAGYNAQVDKSSYFKEIISKQAIAIRDTKLVDHTSRVVEGILHGQIALLAEGESEALLGNMCQFEKRPIGEPGTESVVRGPREGFTESITTNIALIRRRMRSPKLKFEPTTIGKMSQTQLSVAYIEGIVKPEILEEVRKRLKSINTDAILDSGYIEEFIEDSPHSPFPSIQNTERPDVVLSSLLEGRIAIMVDGTPFVLIVPMTLWSAIHAAEDYYEHFIYTSAIRLLRFLLLSVSFLLPSIYVATTTFHPQLIPESLLLTIAAARENVPFPTVVETLLMEVIFEALREAGIRLPKPVGSAVSMVGGLVLGESAVRAGVVSAPTVIVVAFTGIASFSLPRYNLGLAFRLLRFPLLLLAGSLGIYGVGFGVIALLIHLVNLRSFGIPFLAPVAPNLSGTMKDIFIRMPRWKMNERPAFLVSENQTRTPKGQEPYKSQGADNEDVR